MRLRIVSLSWRKRCSCPLPERRHPSRLAYLELLKRWFGDPPRCPLCQKRFEQRIVD